MLEWTLSALLVALLADAVIGDPDWLWRRCPHPVVVVGRMIGWADARWNGGDDRARRLRGLGLVVLLVAGVGGLGLGATALLRAVPLGWIAEGLLAATLLAQRSLYLHVRAVSTGLREGGLAGGRRAVAHVVGRDPEALDEAGVARAAIETLAENFSDGVVAPVFWYAVAGLPGLMAYKAVNTADSMIGHRSPRHLHFGRAAARLDDLVNLVPARAAALLVLVGAGLAGCDVRPAWRALRRDARRHTSPNAGWPEAAMAGALGLALAGPRVYGARRVEAAWMNAGGRAEASDDDLRKALQVYRWACGALFCVVALGLALAV